MIYLDNNATTRVSERVLTAMTPFYREYYGNPHSIHALGRAAHDGLEDARSSVAALLHCQAQEVIFTSCGTEGNALAIRGLVESATHRRRVVTTAVEHASVMKLLRSLEAAGQIELAVAAVGPDGEIDLDALRALIDDRTLLVSVMFAQNETGVIHPVPAIAALAHARGALVHVDAVQAAGKIAVSMGDLDADLLTISGHKFHAPKGVGALALRRPLKLRALWQGGGQELGLRSGTEAVPSLVGLGIAADLARRYLPRYGEVVALRDRFESAVQSAVEDCSVNGSSQPRLGNTSNISFHDTPGDHLVSELDVAGICASAGAACQSGSVEPSATMKAMGRPLNVAMGTVRFSLSRYTTREEVDQAAAVIPGVVRSVREAARVAGSG